MDGVSGHAGLFGSAEDLLTFAEWMLEQADGGTGGPTDSPPDSRARSGAATDQQSSRLTARPMVCPSVFGEFTRRQGIIPESSRALGWDTPAPGSSAGTLLSPRSIGHTGFTGTSLWIDPDHQLAIVLLSNRVHPTRENPRWTPVRAAVADLVMNTLYQDVR
jgi:CubicO group peptidase (beta-lactamase class C family)